MSAFIDVWDTRYRGKEYAYGREPNDFLREEAHRIPPGPVLCIGEGEGRNAVFLAQRGHEVTALDISPEGLRKAELLARERGVTIHTVQADLATYKPTEGAWAGIVSMWVHLPPKLRLQVHGWMHRALRPGGVFLLEAYNPDQLALGTGGPKESSLLMTLDTLRSELAQLRIDLGRHVRREVHEGTFHNGMSATVQVVAVRT